MKKKSFSSNIFTDQADTPIPRISIDLHSKKIQLIKRSINKEKHELIPKYLPKDPLQFSVIEPVQIWSDDIKDDSVIYSVYQSLTSRNPKIPKGSKIKSLLNHRSTSKVPNLNQKYNLVTPQILQRRDSKVLTKSIDKNQPMRASISPIIFSRKNILKSMGLILPSKLKKW